MTPAISAGELAGVFLRLGVTGFGGPAAHVAMMNVVFVQRRGWLSQQAFMDLWAIANVLPGPTSTELALLIGQSLKGWRGLVLAACGFILPSVLLVGLLAACYVHLGRSPWLMDALQAVRPAIVAILCHALWSLRATTGREPWRWVLLVGACILCALAVPAPAVLLFGGLFAVACHLKTDAHRSRMGVLMGVGSVTLASVAGTGSMWLGWEFFKLGATVFGSGYVLFAILQSEWVLRSHVLTSAQLLDAVVVAQVTPGPVFTVATFIGYVLGGVTGAIAATLGIFAPAILLVLIAHRLVPWVRGLSFGPACLDGIGVSAFAMLLVATGQMGFVCVQTPRDVMLAGLALVLLLGNWLPAYAVMLLYALIGPVLP